ncbi:MAG: efflux RND transporter periplasmic adaptor subunit [Planctomycetota bacterium]
MPHPHQRSRPLRAVSALCVLLVPLLCLASCGREASVAALPDPIVEVAVPEVRTVTEYFHYTGTLESFDTAEIRARVDGFLESVRFTESSEVSAGDILFTIERAPYEVLVSRAEASLARASAAVSLAEAQLSRTQSAFDREAANEIELLEDQATLEQAKADVLSAEADLRAARLELSYTDVRSPISGRVDRNYVDVGNLVGRDGATLLARVDVLDPLHVSFDVSESIVLRYLEDGKRTPELAGFPPVELALDDEEGFPHRGRVDFSANRVDGSTGTLTVRALMPNPTGKLFPGLFARIRVPWEERENAVLIREQAVSTGLDGKYVLLVDDANRVSRRLVELGTRQDDGTIVVNDGLSAADRYIVTGVQKARPGAAVDPRPYERETTPPEPAPGPNNGDDA